MSDKLIQDFLILWATIDPLGSMALFSALTAHLTPQARRKTAFKAVGYATAVLVGSIVVGQLLLTAMGISLVSFQLAGGVILFLFGLQMIFGNDDSSNGRESAHDIAIFPLAIPATATPGAILAVILLTDNNVYSIAQQAETTGVLLLIMLITLGFMLLADRILKVIGQGGANLLVKVMGMILAALSVQLVMNALSIGEWQADGI